MNRRPFAPALAVALLCQPAYAQTWSGGGNTLKVHYEEQTIGGEPAVCNMSFVQMVPDDVTRPGKPVLMTGTISFAKPGKNQLAFMLKFIGIDADDPSGHKTTPFSPSFASVSMGSYSSARRETIRMKCDGPGWCAGFTNQNDILALLEVATANTFNVTYQRTQGGLDHSFTVRATAQPEPVSPVTAPFGRCTAAILRSMQ